METTPTPRADRVRVRVLVEGKVQGVFYRASCRREAQGRGLLGWVRNLADGRVEGLFQGPREGVEQMVQWCSRGPRDARVRHVGVMYEEPGDDLKGFEIS